MTRRALIHTFMLALLGCGIAGIGHGAAYAAVPSTLRLYVTADPHTLNPILTTNAEEQYIADLMLETLVVFDGKNQPHPALASVVPTQANGGISADGKTITIHLRHGVKWHDGVGFTAADVLFTIHAILDDKNNVNNRVFYENIASVTAPDPFTVTFHLKGPQSTFVDDVAANYPIVPAHLLAKSANFATDPFDSHPIGTGPYRFVRWQRGDRVELEANPDYRGGAPKIARITIAIVPDSNTLGIMLQQHALDFAIVSSSTYNQLRDVPGIVRSIEPFNDFVALAMNTGRPLMADRDVRLAIVKAIDRKRIARTVTFGTGTPAYADLPLFMYDGHPPAGWDDADPAEAKRLLDAAGWKAGADGIRMKNGVPLRLQYIDFSGSVSGANIDVQVIQMLRDVGIDTSYKTYAPSLYYAPATEGGPIYSGAFDIGGLTFAAGTAPTNSEIYSCSNRIPVGNNSANYCSPEMDRLQAAVVREYDPVKRNRIVAQIEDLAVKDAPYAFLYHTPYRVIVNPALNRPPASLTNPWYDIQARSFKPAP
jgi:peptide/nickel transport system substrate-binding protein